MMNGSRIMCVVGARGFIGQHLIVSAMSAPDTMYHLLSRSKENLRFPEARYISFRGDLREPSIEAGFIVPDATVVNLAYLKDDSIADNIAAVDHLIEQCVSARARLLIHCSTAVVAGAASEKEVDENTKCRPVTQYEKCKLAVEEYMIERCRSRLSLVILRPTVVFGKGGQNLNSIINFVVRNERWKKMLRLSIFDTRHMNLISVENVAAAIHFIASLEPSERHCHYILSHDNQPLNTLGGVVRFISEEMKLPVPAVIPIPFKSFFQKFILRATHGASVVPDRQYDGHRLAAMGFEMPFAFDESVRQYVRHRC